jgi:hypothetical protein
VKGHFNETRFVFISVSLNHPFLSLSNQYRKRELCE